MQSNYVDDYPFIVPSGMEAETQASLIAAMDLLGWKLKKPEEMVAASEFKALGVLLGLPEAGENTLALRNKPERVNADRETIKRIIK